LQELGGVYKPKMNLQLGCAELNQFFVKNNFQESDFRGSKTVRLMKLKKLFDEKLLDNNLRWI